MQHYRNKTQQSKKPAGTSSGSRPKIGKWTTRIQESRRHESWPTNDFRCEPWAARFRSLFCQPCPRNVDCFSCSTSSCLFSSANTRDESTTHCRPLLQTPQYRHMTILSTQITSTTTRVSDSHSRNHHATFGPSLMGVQLNMRHSRHLNMTKDGTRT